MKPVNVKKCLTWSSWTIAILFLALGTLRATPSFLSRNLLPDMRGLSRTQEGPDGLRDDGLRGSPQSIVLLGRIRSDARGTPRDPATLDQVLGGMACASITGRPDGVSVTHCFPSWAQVAGTLPIETRGTADAAFIFQIGSLASTDGQSSVLTIHGGRETGVVRQVTISVTPGGDGDSDVPDPALPPSDATRRGTGAAGPTCDDPSSKDLATFYFRAAPGDGGGHLTFVNHVTGLEVDGAIDEVDVIEMGSTGSPKTVRFSGTCDDSLPPCSFSILVENQDELVRTDDFGIAVATRRVPDPSLSPAGRASLN